MSASTNIPESTGAVRKCPCGEPLTGRQRHWCSEKCRDRKRDRTGRKKKQYPDTRTKRTRPKPGKRIAGIDGESVDNVYVLIVCATDDGDVWKIENPQGLRTAECLRFIARLPRQVSVWGFSFRYDVNMLLVDLTREQVMRLHTEGELYWGSFRIEYRGHKLCVTERERVARTDTGATVWRNVASHTVWDAYPWVQMSFVRWLRKWELCSERTISRVESMKNKRATFAPSQRAQIRRYCTQECVLLAKGVRRLVALIDGTGLKTNVYYSPASLSKARFAQQGVADHMADPPPPLVPMVKAAYFGGRAEVAEIGLLDGPFFAYDLNSAYPAQAHGLPCLACGEWVHGEDDGVRLYQVSWDSGRGAVTWGPFPVRPSTGSIRYPKTGKGWYWGCEVDAARRHTRLKVLDCWTFVPCCDHQPFGYMADVYAERQRLKAAGDPGEIALKLDLNAAYGALAQHPHVRKGEVVESRWRSLMWAGLITAGVRAQLLDVLSDDVVFLATDCAVSRVPLNLPGGSGLGAWGHDEDADVFDRMLVFGTGQYFASRHGEWNPDAKTRGFDKRDVDRDALIALWAKDGRNGVYRFSSQRFIGMGTALRKVCDRWPPWSWRKFVNVEVAKKFDMTPRRVWRTDDPWDGRMVAPSNAQHRALEKADRAELTKLRAEYLRLCDIDERPKPVMKNWAPDAAEVFEEVLTERRRKKMLLLAQRIIFLESDGELFDRQEDPWQGEGG